MERYGITKEECWTNPIEKARINLINNQFNNGVIYAPINETLSHIDLYVSMLVRAAMLKGFDESFVMDKIVTSSKVKAQIENARVSEWRGSANDITDDELKFLYEE